MVDSSSGALPLFEQASLAPVHTSDTGDRSFVDLVRTFSEFGQGSAFEGGHATDLGGPDVESGHFDSAHPHVGWSDSQFPGASPLSPTVICSAVTGLGGFGYIALSRWNWSPMQALALGLAASLALGAASFFALDWMLRKLQSTSVVNEHALIGTKARVQTPIETNQAGGIVLEAKGTRMTLPARAVDSARIPTGAEVEIRRIDGGVYVVEETRESWLARGRSKTESERPN